MMKKLLIFGSIIASTWAFSWIEGPQTMEVNDETPVWEVLRQLGKEEPNHTVDKSVQGASAEKGRDIVLYGITQSPSGGKIKKQSKHFVCTSCHNVVKEDADLSIVDPQARLEYVSKNEIPFLQGTTLYGAVNRTTFYNDDYQKKYGDLVAPARNNLREAIQLCAVECSQGRKLKPWELESVLSYLWTIELKLGDLQLSESDYKKLKKGGDNQALIEGLESKYMHKSPAHFVEPPEDPAKGYNLTGNAENGKLVYEFSCLHCHENKRYSYLHLEDNRQNMRFLKANFDNYAHSSMYMAARHGTPPLYGKRAYMPQYTKERMSNQQVEDLRAYIELRAK